MKKKILTFIFALCLIIPCGIMLTACGKDPNEPSPDNAVSVTIDFILDEDFQFGDQWSVDEATNTYTTTYLNGFVWESSYMFEVVATTESGDTRHLYEATEQNTAGYKVETDMPVGERLPVGTYTYKLYCENFNNGIYKAEACESETYTIIIEKEPIELVGGWEKLSEEYLHYHGGTIQGVNFELRAYSDSFEIDLEEAGITNLNIIENETYKCSAIENGNYVAKIEYDADTTNFDYGNTLPSTTCEWSIKKGSLSQVMNMIWDAFDYRDNYEFEYTGNPIYLINDLEELSNRIQGQGELTLIGLKINDADATFPLSITDVDEYKITPIVTQSDTQHYEDINADPDFDEKYSRTFTITKQKLLASDFYWVGETSVTYNPDETHTLTLNVPQGVTVSYVTEGTTDSRQNTNSAKNAGQYLAKAIINFDEDFYELDTTPTLECQWEIIKAPLDAKRFSWYLGGYDKVVAELPYDASNSVRPTIQHTLGYEITIKHYDSENNEINNGLIELGTYKSIATINYDTTNYYLENESFLEYEWSVVKGNYVNDASWSYYAEIEGEAPEILEVDSTSITLSKADDTTYCFFFSKNFNLAENLTIKYSLDGGNTFITLLAFDASIIGTYTITVIVDGQDLEHFNPIDTSAFTLTINIVEA